MNNVERWQQEAADNNLQFVEYRNGPNNVYLLPCGHEQKLTPEEVSEGNITCSVCGARDTGLGF